MAKASEIVSKAKSQVGITESPAGSNKVKYWDYYKKKTGADYNGQPWCAAFVAWVMWECGVWDTRNDEGYLRYCPSLVNKAKKDGTWLGRTSEAKPGDIVLFANGSTACHVGIVVKRVSATEVQTVEGNTSAGSNANGGQVQLRNRSYGSVGSSWYILGFMRPKYDADGVKKDTTKKETSKKESTTKTLCKEVQKSLGVSADGVFGTVSKDAWFKKVTYVSTTKKSKGKWAKYVQRGLIAKGYSCGKCGADGEFGKDSNAALRKFQKDKGLTVDGKAGINTAYKLFN